MTIETRRRMADAGLWLAVGGNTSVVLMDVALQLYTRAAWQFTFVVALIAASEGFARFRVWIELQIEKARADRDLAQMAFEQFALQMKRGNVRFAVDDVTPSRDPKWKN